MLFRERLWTYSLVTVVAVLIWYWAAVQTRDEASASFRIEFAPAAPSEQIVDPREVKATLEVEGSRLAIQRARELAAATLTLGVGSELPAEEAEHRIDLKEVLQEHEPLAGTGVRILSADPASLNVRIDRLVPVEAEIKPVLPGVEPEGETVEPPRAVVKLPSRLLEHIGDELTVEAHIPQARLERLEPGMQHTIENVPLRLPSRLAGERAIRITPPLASVRFTIRSQIKETTLPTVRVQIAGPPEDNDEFVVQIEENTLADVTVKARDDLIRKIERGDARVVALVHLSTRDKERGIESKPVTCFMALPANEASDVVATIVEAEVGGSAQPPVIRLAVSERAGAP